MALFVCDSGVVREGFRDIWGLVVEEAGAEGFGLGWFIGRESLVSEDRGYEGDSPSVVPFGDMPEVFVCCGGQDFVGPFAFGVDRGLFEGASGWLDVLFRL